MRFLGGVVVGLWLSLCLWAFERSSAAGAAESVPARMHGQLTGELVFWQGSGTTVTAPVVVDVTLIRGSFR